MAHARQSGDTGADDSKRRKARPVKNSTLTKRQKLLRQARNRRYYQRRKMRNGAALSEHAGHRGLQQQVPSHAGDATQPQNNRMTGHPKDSNDKVAHGGTGKRRGGKAGLSLNDTPCPGPVGIAHGSSVGNMAHIDTLNQELLSWGYMEDRVKYCRALDKNLARALRASPVTRAAWIADMEEWLADGDDFAEELCAIAERGVSPTILSVIFTVQYMIAAVEARLEML
ncbi:hypothetical protein K466DRAFT_605169 [Polyporus arcularius HHB13444]|uniref:Uncharacterized protein n=1 Tax=Polyporus arcularius HHB13444 TaxID=1314778 RepID=A0A5C3NWC8_9APHY|nr:hypothetical protein K466DRAFT_605169 [Polyporus arcularius HHB13444]